MLLSDNQGAIALVRDDRFHSRTKHIDIRYHFIHKAFQLGKISVTYGASAENTADILTKPLLCSPKMSSFKSLSAGEPNRLRCSGGKPAK
jgi:hypothetical protein